MLKSIKTHFLHLSRVNTFTALQHVGPLLIYIMHLTTHNGKLLQEKLSVGSCHPRNNQHHLLNKKMIHQSYHNHLAVTQEDNWMTTEEINSKVNYINPSFVDPFKLEWLWQPFIQFIQINFYIIQILLIFPTLNEAQHFPLCISFKSLQMLT